MSKKLSLISKIGYGMGALSESTMQNAVMTMMLPIFNIVLGVNPIYLGYAAAIARIWDALSDPAVGFFSDNTSSRFGRRKPYILLGSLGAGLAFIAIWMCPSSWNEWSYFWYFVITSIIYYTFTTIYCVPYISYGYELSDDYNERTSLMGYRMFFVGISTVAINWMLLGTQLTIFENTLIGMRYVSVAVAIVFVIFALGPLLLTGKEKCINSPNDDANKAKVKVIDIFSSFKVRPFSLVAVALMSGMLGIGSIAGLGTYIVIYYICSGSLEFSGKILGVMGTVYGVSGIVIIPIINYLANKYGKKAAMLLMYLIGMVGTLGSWFLFNPAFPYLACVSNALLSPCLSALFMLLFSMTADICEWDRITNKLNREGVFAAVLSWATKFGFTIAMVVAGYLLVWSGFDSKLDYQTVETITNMRILYMVIATGGLLLGTIAIAFYPLSKAKLEDLKRTSSFVSKGRV